MTTCSNYFPQINLMPAAEYKLQTRFHFILGAGLYNCPLHFNLARKVNLKCFQ